MGRIVYVNGRFVAEEEATISIFDRGFLFGDAVYEVTAVIDGRLVDFAAHMARLDRSLTEMEIVLPLGAEELLDSCRRLIAMNGLVEGLIYLQVSRGVADRDFHFPDKVQPTLVMFTQQRPSGETAAGLRIVTLPDIRWQRRDIKTVQLLAASMAKMTARRAAKDDAWLVEEGLVTEGTSSNAYIVTAGQKIVTRRLSTSILPGVTRQALFRLVSEEGLDLEERAFSVAEAQQAREAFITSATAYVTPVVEIDDVPVGDGRPGPLSLRLRKLYLDESVKQAI